MQLVASENTFSGKDEKEIHDRRRRFQLARLITLSEEMLGHAGSGDWEKVEELEILRRVELDECFTLQNEHPSMLIAQALAALVHINDQIVALVRQARDKLGSELSRDHTAHKAASAYLQASE